jgi:adenylate cyclase
MISPTKVLSQLSKWIQNPFSVGLVLTLVLFALVDFYYRFHQDAEMSEKYPLMAEVERLHNQTVDFRLRRRGPRPGSEDVAILTIDEKAIQKYGRWPWPRHQIAQVIDDIIEAGAKSISFDIIFSEKQEDVLLSLERVGKNLSEKLPQYKDKIQSLIGEEKQQNDHDKTLTEVIEKHNEHLVMGAIYDEFEYRPFPFQEVCYQNISKINKVYDYWEKEAYLIGVQNAMEVNLPPSWHKILQQHFHSLQENVVFQWLKNNPEHPATLYLVQNSYLPTKKNTVESFTQWLLGASPQWPQQISQELNEKFPHKDRVNLTNRMDRELNNYCLRYLTDKDELEPQFKKKWPQITSEYEKFQGLSFEEARDFIMVTSLKNPVHIVDRWLLNIPEIKQVTEHSGTFNATQDKDGSVRRARLFVRSGSLFIPSLAFKAFLLIRDLYPTAHLLPNPYDKKQESAIMTHIQLKNSDDELVLTIPTDHRGQLPINYAGPQKMFAYLSAGEILDGGDRITIEQRRKNEHGEWVEDEFEVDKEEFLKDKNFVFGATATGVYDLRVTPFEENYPGVETHANLLDNLLRQDYLKTDTREEYLMPYIVLALGLLFSLIVAKLGAIMGLLATLSSLVGIYLLDSLLIFPNGTVIVILFPILSLLILYISLTFYKYLTEERMKKELKGTFQKYVSPEIVNEILKDPEKLELGGSKQEMSVFFSDIRGFTTISERLDPKALSDLLNDYLTPMTEIIFANSGTLDKYMGDAIMAFFGAPVHSDQHAAQACRAALQQIDQLFILQKKYVEQGLPMIDIGIGINTGEMSVGNMGSETVRNYTVMGDAVNLGARLEGINKQYGTRIIISEFTVAQISPQDFIFREIDWVRVKGKNKPVRIFELIGEGAPDDGLKQRLDHFRTGFELYHKQEWEQAIHHFNQALKDDASDQTSQLYIKRCQDYMTHPPSNDWDGVFVMTSK